MCIGVAVIAFGNKGLGNQLPTWGKPHSCHGNRGTGSVLRGCQEAQVWEGLVGRAGGRWGGWASGPLHHSQRSGVANGPGILMDRTGSSAPDGGESVLGSGLRPPGDSPNLYLRVSGLSHPVGTQLFSPLRGVGESALWGFSAPHFLHPSPSLLTIEYRVPGDAVTSVTGRYLFGGLRLSDFTLWLPVLIGDSRGNGLL